MTQYAFLFPGQGAQYVGMGKDFYNEFLQAREVFEEADDILQQNLSHRIFSGSEEELKATKNSQPAIFVTSYAILQTLRSLFPHIIPAACAGLSLGEYTALVAASYLSFDKALPIVQCRGRFMHDACEKTKGTMAVVLGLDDEKVESLVKALHMPNDIWTANFNCPGQVVISGTIEGVAIATQALLKAGAKKVMPLQVHGAFHSNLMKEAQDALTPYLRNAPLQAGTCPIVMNVSGEFAKSLDDVQQLLIQQVTSPVRWSKGIRTMDASGITHFIEIGCGKTLAGMNKRIGIQACTINIEKVEDLKNVQGITS